MNQEKNWCTQLSRLITRKRIESLLPSARTNIFEVRHRVRNEDTRAQAEALAQSLLDQPFQEPPHVKSFLEKALPALKERYGDRVVALFTFGSSAHGGSQVRSLIGVTTDIDCGFIYQGVPLSKKESHSISRETYRIFSDLADPTTTKIDHGLVTGAPYLENVDQAYGLVSNQDNLTLISYLHPTYPEHIGEDQRQKIKQAFDRLLQENPTKWSEAAEGLITLWQALHRLGEKHFETTRNSVSTEENKTNRQLIDEVTTQSPSLMSAKLRSWLTGSK